MAMRILVSGGNGFVGREVVRRLLGAHEVCVVDALRSGRVRFEAEESARLRFERADICDATEMERVVGSFAPEAIIHLAAIHYIPECENDPALAARTNISGTVNLLAATPRGCKFVFASSGAVYKPDTEPHAEATAVVEPSDIYGITKLQGEHYVAHLARARDLPAVVVRLFNVVGPGETNPHLLPEIVAQLKAGRREIRLGNIWPKRDYIHVEDAASGFVAATLDSSVGPGETLTVNLGTARSYSVASVVRKLRRISGTPFGLARDGSRVRAVDRPVLTADTTRIRTLLGWQATRSIDDALADLWRDPDLSEALTARYL